MRRRLGQGLRVGVSGAGLALLKTSRWFGAPATLLAEQRFADAVVPDAAAMGDALGELLAAAGGARGPLRIVLADDLVRIWRVTPAPGSARLADLEAAAAVRFHALYGEPLTEWVVTAGWDAGAPFLAAAMPRALRAALEQAAAAQRVPVIEIVPQFIAGWNRWRGALAPGAWYGQLHDGVLTLGVTADARLCALRSVVVPADAGRDWLVAHVAREALRLDVAPPAQLQLSGPVPAHWRGGVAAAGLVCGALSVARAPAWSACAELAATGSRA
jgi:hypothetical protein